jgi:FkbM family methyltransferase
MLGGDYDPHSTRAQVMKLSVRDLAQGLLRPFKLKISRILTQDEIRAGSIEAGLENLTWLTAYEIKTVLDIGANTGQFAEKARRLFPGARIYSFEPLERCYQELIGYFAGVEGFQAFNFALGDRTGEAEIFCCDYSPSSSMLPMGEVHKEAFPYTRDQTVQKIQIRRLDDLADQLELQRPLLVKMDVQGFEDRVIAGGLLVLGQADVVISELSVEPLYEGQPLFDVIYQRLTNLGFVYKGAYEQLRAPDDNRVLQLDGVFVRSRSGSSGAST